MRRDEQKIRLVGAATPKPKENPVILTGAKEEFFIQPQPDDTTCGPTCLHAVYHYYNDVLPLEEVIRGVRQLPTGGTLACLLGLHALRRGYKARIYTLNIEVFDPTWFREPKRLLASRLKAQMEVKGDNERLVNASKAYVEFLEMGGQIRQQDFTTRLVRKHLRKGQPLLTGLSATYLYGCARECGSPSRYDSIRGLPTGHFVTVYGYDARDKMALVADPLCPNPMAYDRQHYHVPVQRLIWSVLLGALTYDANILVVFPKKPGKE